MTETSDSKVEENELQKFSCLLLLRVKAYWFYKDLTSTPVPLLTTIFLLPIFHLIVLDSQKHKEGRAFLFSVWFPLFFSVFLKLLPNNFKTVSNLTICHTEKGICFPLKQRNVSLPKNTFPWWLVPITKILLVLQAHYKLDRRFWSWTKVSLPHIKSI